MDQEPLPGQHPDLGDLHGVGCLLLSARLLCQQHWLALYAPGPRSINHACGAPHALPIDRAVV